MVHLFTAAAGGGGVVGGVIGGVVSVPGFLPCHDFHVKFVIRYQLTKF